MITFLQDEFFVIGYKMCPTRLPWGSFITLPADPHVNGFGHFSKLSIPQTVDQQVEGTVEHQADVREGSQVPNESRERPVMEEEEEKEEGDI